MCIPHESLIIFLLRFPKICQVLVWLLLLIFLLKKKKQP